MKYVKEHISNIYDKIAEHVSSEHEFYKILKEIGAKTDDKGNVKLIRSYDGIYVEIPVIDDE